MVKETGETPFIVLFQLLLFICLISLFIVAVCSLDCPLLFNKICILLLNHWIVYNWCVLLFLSQDQSHLHQALEQRYLKYYYVVESILSVVLIFALALWGWTLIHRWRCDASRALEVTYQHGLQCHALLEVIIIDLLND